MRRSCFCIVSIALSHVCLTDKHTHTHLQWGSPIYTAQTSSLCLLTCLSHGADTGSSGQTRLCRLISFFCVCLSALSCVLTTLILWDSCWRPPPLPLDHTEFPDLAKNCEISSFLSIYLRNIFLKLTSPFNQVSGHLPACLPCLCSSEEHPLTCVFTFLLMKKEFPYLLVTSSLWDAQPYMALRVIQSVMEAAVRPRNTRLHSRLSHGQCHHSAVSCSWDLAYTHTPSHTESLSVMLQNKFWLFVSSVWSTPPSACVV